MTSTTKFIVWDWNGTLLDDIDIIRHAVNLSMEPLGYGPYSLATLQEHSDLPFTKVYRNLGMSEQEVTAHYPVLREKFYDHYERYVGDADLRKGGHDVLAYARRHGVAHLILSNHFVKDIAAHLERLCGETSFTAILAFADRHEQLAWAKPKGERLREYMQEHRLASENGLIIGDTAEEVEIARDTGLTSIAVTGGVTSESRLRAVEPDYVIHALDELLPILRERGWVS